MKHPFWIVNSTLFFIILCACAFIYLSRVSLPYREEIEPRKYTHVARDQVLQINISKIYEQDIFDTFKKPAAEEPDYSIPFPQPPEPQSLAIPKPPEPQFLDPLDITLKGIIVIGSTPEKNSAIIEDNKTNQEDTYKVGDAIDDSQLVRIFNNKIIFLRSNGQQEVLYLRQQDAKLDPAYALISNWEPVVLKASDDDYIINSKEFIKRVKNLGQFIDMFGLTTVFQKGQSIGSRIGHIGPKSLGAFLGLQSYDVIVSINNIPATTNDLRMKIYQSVMATQKNATITIALRREGVELIRTITFKEFSHKKSDSNIQKDDSKSEDESSDKAIEAINQNELEEKEKRKLLKKRRKFAPTSRQLRDFEKRNMTRTRRSPLLGPATEN